MRFAVVSVVVLSSLDRSRIPVGRILYTSCFLAPVSLVLSSWAFDGASTDSDCGVWVPWVRFLGMSDFGVLDDSTVVIWGVAWS